MSEIFLTQMPIFFNKRMGLSLKFRAFRVQFSDGIQIFGWAWLQFSPGGGGTSLWVRRGCAPVLGSFWPENSGIGVSF